MDNSRSNKTTDSEDAPKRNPKTGRFEKSAARRTTTTKPPATTSKSSNSDRSSTSDRSGNKSTKS
jgi:hypothetical protein